MPRRIFDELNNWAEGVNTSASADLLPSGAVPRLRNAYLRDLGAGTAVIGTRKGPETRNRTPVPGAFGVRGGFQFKRKDGAKYNLLLSDTGRLDKLNDDDTTSVILSSAVVTGAQHTPIFEVANDTCFIATDVDLKKTDGSTVWQMGISTPAAPTAGAAAGGSTATGAWDVAITHYNANTGHESSRSAFTTVNLTAGNQKINVSWVAPTDSQVTHVRVHVRQQSAGSNSYQVVAGATPAPDATTGGFPVSTLSTVLDISATQYAAFIILTPGPNENNAPTVGWQYPTFHDQRMFLADSGNLYYSNIKANVSYPESFNSNNVQPVNPNDGDTIMGLASYAGVLLIFKKYSIYYLEGSDPSSWVVKLLTKDFGLSSMRSIVRAGGALYFWAGALGPAVMKGLDIPVSLGKAMLASTISPDMLNHNQLNLIVGGVDEANQTVLWAVPEYGQTRNTLVLPFNYQLARFASDAWNVFDIESMWVVEKTTNLRALYVGNYAGQVFEWWKASSDGIATGTTSAGSVTSATSTTLTDSTATFDTTGGGLVERYVYVLSQDRLTVQRRRITANTATQLTVSTAWDVTPNTTYTYVVGGIDFEVDTPWQLSGLGFFKKRYEFFLVRAATDAAFSIDVDLFTSYDLDTPKRTKTLTLTPTIALWDSATWDVSKWGGAPVLYGKLRAAITGRAWRARLRYVGVNKNLILYGVAMQGVPMSIKH